MNNPVEKRGEGEQTVFLLGAYGYFFLSHQEPPRKLDELHEKILGLEPVESSGPCEVELDREKLHELRFVDGLDVIVMNRPGKDVRVVHMLDTKGIVRKDIAPSAEEGTRPAAPANPSAKPTST